jgi:excisionase family DNA binding protein
MSEEEFDAAKDPTASDLVTVTQAAAILGIHRVSVHRMIASGVLEAFHPPPRYRSKGLKRLLKRVDVERLATGEAGHGRRKPRAAPDRPS